MKKIEVLILVFLSLLIVAGCQNTVGYLQPKTTTSADTPESRAVQAVLNNNLDEIGKLEQPYKMLAIDQYSLNHQDVSACGEGTSECAAKVLFFSCVDSSNKEECERNLMIGSGALKKLVLDYTESGSSYNVELSYSNTGDSDNKCEIEINYPGFSREETAKMLKNFMLWNKGQKLEDTGTMRWQTGENENVCYASTKYNYGFCRVLDRVENMFGGSFLCNENKWEVCDSSNLDKQVSVNGLNFECNSNGAWAEVAVQCNKLSESGCLKQSGKCELVQGPTFAKICKERSASKITGKAVTGVESITGCVENELGDRLPGATIYVLGTTLGGETGDEGCFAISGVNTGQRYNVKIVSIGSLEKTVSIRSGENPTIVLESGAIAGEETIVKADVPRVKADVPKAVVTITAEGNTYGNSGFAIRKNYDIKIRSGSIINLDASESYYGAAKLPMEESSFKWHLIKDNIAVENLGSLVKNNANNIELKDFVGQLIKGEGISIVSGEKETSFGFEYSNDPFSTGKDELNYIVLEVSEDDVYDYYVQAVYVSYTGRPVAETAQGTKSNYEVKQLSTKTCNSDADCAGWTCNLLEKRCVPPDYSLLSCKTSFRSNVVYYNGKRYNNPFYNNPLFVQMASASPPQKSSCVSSTRIRIPLCDDGLLLSHEENCPSGSTCSDEEGICKKVSTNLCIDDYSLSKKDDCWNQDALCQEGKCVKFENLGWKEEILKEIKYLKYIPSDALLALLGSQGATREGDIVLLVQQTRIGAAKNIYDMSKDWNSYPRETSFPETVILALIKSLENGDSKVRFWIINALELIDVNSFSLMTKLQPVLTEISETDQDPATSDSAKDLLMRINLRLQEQNCVPCESGGAGKPVGGEDTTCCVDTVWKNPILVIYADLTGWEFHTTPLPIDILSFPKDKQMEMIASGISQDDSGFIAVANGKVFYKVLFGKALGGVLYKDIQKEYQGRMSLMRNNANYDNIEVIKMLKAYVREELKSKGMEDSRVEYRLYIGGITYYYIKRGLEDYEIEVLTDFKKGQEEVIFYVWLPNNIDLVPELYGHKVVNLWKPETGQDSDGIDYEEINAKIEEIVKLAEAAGEYGAGASKTENDLGDLNGDGKNDMSLTQLSFSSRTGESQKYVINYQYISKTVHSDIPSMNLKKGSTVSVVITAWDKTTERNEGGFMITDKYLFGDNNGNGVIDSGDTVDKSEVLVSELTQKKSERKAGKFEIERALDILQDLSRQLEIRKASIGVY